MKIKGLTTIAVLSSIIILWINFVDIKLPELIPGKGPKIENLIENICLAYVTGFMFYYLNIYLVERKEKKSILPYIARYVQLMVVNNHSIINCLKNDSKLDPNYFPTKEEFKVLLAGVRPKEKIPFYYKNENWIYLFKNRQESTLRGLNKIFMSGKHLDDELRRLLLEIQSSLYLTDNYAFNSDDFSDSDLSKYWLVFSNHFELIKKLKAYYDKNLKVYSTRENQAL